MSVVESTVSSIDGLVSVAENSTFIPISLQ